MALGLFCLTKAAAQDLSGQWQGVETHLPRMGFWPAVLTIQEDKSSHITGMLEQEVGNQPTSFVRFQVDGQHTPPAHSARPDQDFV
ncbi:hypothetical protein GCM10023185_24160 [Hymenobacter saemangeumensis]|uniref:DUF2147 domain-containing protein n=2 Tax=Hymenobacter saemangeumensis TaxID=1084522 RepID=A0ABP8IGJ8_9BACT